jgi:hypothetical protein
MIGPRWVFQSHVYFMVYMIWVMETNMNMVERTEFYVPTVKRVVDMMLPELSLRSASLCALALCFRGGSRSRDRGFQTHGTFSC